MFYTREPARANRVKSLAKVGNFIKIKNIYSVRYFEKSNSAINLPYFFITIYIILIKKYGKLLPNLWNRREWLKNEIKIG